jgi:hypothetical protein
MTSFELVKDNYTSVINSEICSILNPKKLLRINTFEDFRENTPSPPPAPKRSPIRTIHKNFSPKPKSILKIIDTPRSGTNELPLSNKKLEDLIENIVDNMMKEICCKKTNETKLIIKKNISDLNEDLELMQINKEIKKIPSLLNKNTQTFFQDV